MKKGLKGIAIATVAMLSLGLFAGCGSEKSDVPTIGVVQQMQHVALDAAYQGFVDGLKEAGYSEEDGTIKFNYQVATGKADECATIANQLVGENPNLILAIATDAAVAAVNATDSIPVLVTAVTNPEGDCPGKNMTGVSDLGPIADQVAFAKEICPDLQTIGFLYNSSERNSKFQVEMAIAAANELGIPYKEFTVTAATELQSVVESMKDQVQAVWIPTDNTCASNMPIIQAAAEVAGVMTICGEAGMVESGGLVTCGAVDYYKLGKQTAAMAVKVLQGTAPADLPIEFQDAGEEMAITINTDVAAAFDIPQSVLDKAEKVTTKS